MMERHELFLSENVIYNVSAAGAGCFLGGIAGHRAIAVIGRKLTAALRG
jgi:hypothetical protein